jgi:putative ABC transport system permease protein
VASINWIRALWRNLIHRADVERELDEEIRAYGELLAESKLDKGIGAKEVGGAASTGMDGIEQIKETVREVRAGYQIETCLRDLRFGLRMLARSPGFTIVAVLTLALGVGANSAIFSVVNAVLLRPLPFEEPDSLVRVYATATWSGDQTLIEVTSFKDLADWKQQNDVFERLAIFTGDDDLLTGPDGIQQIKTADVSDGFFELLRVNPILGRTFTESDRPGHRLGENYPITGADGVNIMGEAFWRQRFGADPNIIGRTVIVDGYPSTVIGVVPDRFDTLVGHAQLYFPFAVNEADGRGDRHLRVIGRLLNGITVGQAAVEMEGIAARLRDQYPDDNYKIGATVLPLGETIVGSIRRMLLVLLGAVALVLLIACANVANLLLARGAGRWQEAAIRSALGANRLRLLRQFLSESLVLSIMGGAVALVVAFAVVRILIGLAPANIPRLNEIGLDRDVIGFTILLSILTSLIFGLTPALRLSGQAFAEALKAAGRGPRGGRRHTATRRLLVISELAISLMLLTTCGLLIKSFYRLRSVNPGFDPTNLVGADVVLPEPEDNAPNSRKLFYDRVYRQLASIQGAKSVALTSVLPIRGGDSSWYGYVPEGRPFTRDEQVGGQYRRVSPGYFSAMRIPLVQGREFDDLDGRPAQQVVIISQTMARRLWPDETAIGKHLLSGDRVHTDARLVVGVAADVKRDALDNPDDYAVYVPCAQDPGPFWIVVARAASDRSSLGASIKSAIQSVDSDLPVYNIRTMDQALDGYLALRKFNLMLVSAFAGLALLLAAVGAYGIISYSVAERTQEIGVRMALGATRIRIMSLIVGQGFRLALVGTAIGLAGACGLTRVIAALLFNVSPTDPATFALVAAFLFAISMLASYVPASRATRVDPMRALRSE